ncbi:MAG: HK97 family phage prohead protease [Bacteroidaceae bacterium]|nr:HK97 family phage prohead protease [Bacteroidaceae bacterium]
MKQTRFIPFEDCGLQIREPQEGQTESRTIEGTPIVFGVRSVNLTPWSDTREVYEVLEPGCITQELISRSDVILNLNHSNMVPDVLGRCRNGKGTLELELRENKIGCRCDLPHTNNANDALELMKRGDITGMSFAFEDDYQDSENGVSYERTAETHDGKEVWLRHVKRITGLYDVAIVTHPAYEQTSVGVRELGDIIDKAIDLQIEIEKREAEDEQKRACGGGKDDKRDDDPDDKDDDKGETDEEHERERMIAMQHRRSMRRHLVERMIDSL